MNHKVEQPRHCGARTRSGDTCQLEALPDKPRCRLHGSAGGRPRGTPEHPKSRAARLEGRRRWVERMRAAKARGEIERFPGGRRARGLPPLSRDPTIRKAQRILEARVSKAVVPPASNATKADKLGEATDKSLDLVLAFLNRDVDPAKDPKLFAQQINSAHLTINTQVRVDNAKLAAEALGPAGLNEQELRERARRAIREAFAERPPRDNGPVIEHEPEEREES